MVAVNNNTKTLQLNKKKKMRHPIPYVYTAITLLCLLLRNAGIVNIPVIFFLAFTGVAIVFGDNTDIVAVAVSLVSVGIGFQAKYAALLCVVVLLLKNYNSIKARGALFAVVLMMVWELLHGFVGYFSVYEYIRGFSSLLLIATVVCTVSNDIDTKTVLNTYSLGAAGICVVKIIVDMRILGFGVLDYLDYISHYRFGALDLGDEMFTLNFNANALGFICVTSIAAQLILISRKESSLVGKVSMVISVIAGAMTLSRAFVFMAFFTAVYYILFTGKDIKERVKNILIFLVLAVLIVAILLNIFPQILEGIFDRFDVDDISNGRNELFAFYNMHIFSGVSNLLFGIGLQDIPGKVATQHNVSMDVPHNGIQQLVVVWGIVGLVLFAVMVVNLVKNAGAGWKKENRILYLPLFLTLLYTMSGQLITSDSVLLSFVLIYACLLGGKKKEEKE